MSATVDIYRYELEKGSKKFRCPGCNKKRFVRYIDQQTGDYLPEKYGRCDREVKCGYFMNPYKDGYAKDNGTDWHKTDYQLHEPKPTDYIPYEVFSASLIAYKKNKFISYLRTLFNDSTVSNLIKKYCIGSSKHWQGSTVFWQIDQQGNIRSGKVMLYDNEGLRVKQPFNHIHWVHALIYERFNLDQCLFGEHLLTDDKSIPVAIVESEKTAIISSVYFPEFIWLAAGAKSNLKAERCKCLMSRRVVLYPDIGAFNDWQSKANDLSYFCDIDVSDLLETIADSKAKYKGYDLADYLMQFDPKEFTDKNKPLESKYKSKEYGNRKI
jgi:hypothetical protein